MSTPDAGWYPDETEPYLMRWFDGEAWTEDTAPLPAAAPAHEPEHATVASGLPAFVASGLPALVPVPVGGAVWYPDGTEPIEPGVPRHLTEPGAAEAHELEIAAVPRGRRAARLAAAVETSPTHPVGPPPPPPAPEPTTGLTAVPTGRRAARLAAAAATPGPAAPGSAAPDLAAPVPEVVAVPPAMLVPTLEPFDASAAPTWPSLRAALVAARPVLEHDRAPEAHTAQVEVPAPAGWAHPGASPVAGPELPAPAPAALTPVGAHPYAPPAPGTRAPDGGWTGPQAFPGGQPHAEPPPRPGDDPRDVLHWIVPLGRSWQSIAAGYLGLVGLILWPLAPVAVGLGAWAMVKARSGGHGRGRAVFAIVTGLAGTAFGVVFLISLGGAG